MESGQARGRPVRPDRAAQEHPRARQAFPCPVHPPRIPAAGQHPEKAGGPLIGDRWLTITDDAGARRLDHPDDFVRIEIEAALSRDVRIIPILIEGARMPSAAALPRSLAPLAHRQALELSPSRFQSDTSRLLEVLEKTLAEERALTEESSIEPRSPSGEQTSPDGVRVDWSLACPLPRQGGARLSRV